MTKSKPTTNGPIEKQAAATSKRLRQFHKMGVEANKAAGSASYGDNVNEQTAKKYGRTASSVTHARMFAERVDQAELDEICELRNKKGAAFGRGLATKLFPLTERKDRDRFLLRWKNESLSARKLDAVIRAKFGKSDRSGRKSTQPTSPAGAISQLHDRCSSWLKWYEQLANEDVGAVSLKKLPAPVRKQLIATMIAVKKLHDVTARVE